MKSATQRTRLDILTDIALTNDDLEVSRQQWNTAVASGEPVRVADSRRSVQDILAKRQQLALELAQA